MTRINWAACGKGFVLSAKHSRVGRLPVADLNFKLRQCRHEGRTKRGSANDKSHACLHLPDQNPLVMLAAETVQSACKSMCERRAGSVLVVDDHQRLIGILTGRDAVRTLARGKSVARTTLEKAMTPNPVTVTPDQRAIDALRAMSDGGFRHVPVVEDSRDLTQVTYRIALSSYQRSALIGR